MPKRKNQKLGENWEVGRIEKLNYGLAETSHD